MSKHFCFTCNNWTENEVEVILKSGYSYVVMGEEIGGCGTPHLQGYIEFEKKKKLGTAIKLLKKCHVEYRNGTQEEAIKYCKKGVQTKQEWFEYKLKGGGWLGPNWGRKAIIREFGTPSVNNQGKRVDIDTIREIAQNGGMREVSAIAKNPMQIKIAEKYLEYNDVKRNWKPEITWIWGGPRLGKSRLARRILNNDDNIYTKNTNTKWWNGYDGHEQVIIDDFRDSWWPLTYMLGLLDRYEFVIEVKGSERQFRGRNIVITSIHHPNTFYHGCRGTEPVEQLLGRLTQIIHLTGTPSTEAIPLEIEISNLEIEGYNKLPDKDKDTIEPSLNDNEAFMRDLNVLFDVPSNNTLTSHLDAPTQQVEAVPKVRAVPEVHPEFISNPGELTNISGAVPEVKVAVPEVQGNNRPELMEPIKRGRGRPRKNK
nr:MAG: replication polyprotein [Chemarfal virus 68]